MAIIVQHLRVGSRDYALGAISFLFRGTARPGRAWRDTTAPPVIDSVGRFYACELWSPEPTENDRGRVELHANDVFICACIYGREPLYDVVRHVFNVWNVATIGNRKASTRFNGRRIKTRIVCKRQPIKCADIGCTRKKLTGVQKVYRDLHKHGGGVQIKRIRFDYKSCLTIQIKPFE